MPGSSLRPRPRSATGGGGIGGGRMRIKMKVKTVVILLVFLLLPGVSHALTVKQRALGGLKGMGVMVEDMRPEAERLGLTRNQIQTDVELRLRKAGVRVLTEKEKDETPGMPYLYVNVNTMFDSASCVFSITVELSEWVTLARGFKTSGRIWQSSSVGIVGINKLSQIRVSVGELVDKFINDYLAANPKK
jgi:hypothetical protein